MAEEYSDQDHYQGVNYKRFFQNKINAVLSCYDQNNKRGMKMAFNDVNRSAKSETKNIQKLNELLREKFGRSLIDQQKKDQKKIEHMMAVGKIDHEEDVELIQGRIDDLIQEDKNEEAQILDALLFSNKSHLP